MDKKRIYHYVFLTVCIVVVSLTLPYLIRFVSGNIVNRISSGRITETEGESETESESESEKPAGMTTIGDPSLYQEEPGQPGIEPMDPEEKKQAEKYELLSEEYQTYLKDFTKEVTASDSMKPGMMEQFIRYDPDQFYEAAATFSYANWGTARTIRKIRFDSLTSYVDDNGNEIEQAMVEFLHTGHPDTEEGTQVVCIYYVNQGYYYFP